MEPQPQPSKPSHLSRSSHPQLQTIIPPPPASMPLRTAHSTPVSSPGLFSPAIAQAAVARPQMSEGTTPNAALNSPYLHPLQGHKVRETHKANVDTDFTTGRKLINHYEIIDELGRGMHGKVKLARDLETGENVAIKIIPRFSKKRRLGKVTAMSTQDKSKKEIAILKKIRHPNVVALIEIIDDPELKKIYMVLEHVELGEVVWRKKGLPHICNFERRRVEREMRGEQPYPEEERYEQLMEQRQALKDLKRAKLAQRQVGSDYWSLEHCPVDDEDAIATSRSIGRDLDTLPLAGSASASKATSRAPSRAPSRTHSAKSLARSGTPHPSEPELPPIPADGELETFGSLPSNSAMGALDGTMFGPYMEDPAFRGRSPSMADSIISHMSSLDYRVHDPFVDDFSYVPCFTIEAARSSFRDTVLGLEYLHYQGVVHRDIKPANLLCTKDYRVKISDFGVSYFGRPIRDGEPDDTVSESEARDFDNDLELAKTVGTPAFFAPELCYTDESAGLQPKVSEQIDVWSLGVTLYCLIFARIPFLAEDEWQMFKKIATENVYIPTKRLRPVDPSTKPDENSLYTRVNSAPYRDDDELAYEEIDWQLHDLLSKMLIKNPDQRIRLKEVKRHPWVVQGMPDRDNWVRDTDLSARHTGKIQVDEKEMAHAVVPLNFVERTLERTKSTFSGVKKTIGKIMNPRGERAESASRRRAASSVSSSVGDKLSVMGTSGTPQPREGRRKSLRGDVDYFATLTDAQPYTEYASTYGVAANETPAREEGPPPSAVQLPAHSVGGQPARQVLELAADFNPRFSNVERQTAAPGPQKPATRHAHARSVTNAFLSLTPSLRESQTVPPSPSTHFDGPHDDPSSALRKARDMRPPVEDNSRARSVDRGLFASNDKRAEALVSLSTATAPGNLHLPYRPLPIRSSGFAKETEGILQPSPLSPSAPRALAGYQHGQPQSDPNMQSKRRSFVELAERPMTAHRVRDWPDAQISPPRAYNSTSESFGRAQKHLVRRQALELAEERKRQQVLEATPMPEPAGIPCPPSPDDEPFLRQEPAILSREDTMKTNLSSSSTSMGATITPLTSPSLTTSPTCASTSLATKETTEQMLAFQSDPSLPALLSSTSSVSADPEGDFLGNPGVVDQPSSVIDTTDSLTPPALSKEPIAGFPLEAEEHLLNGHSINSVIVPVAFSDRQPALRTSSAPPVRSVDDNDDEDDDDSDSDEGLTMGKSQRGRTQIKDRSSFGKFAARRRDTNASVGSTDTAKKLTVDQD